MEDETTQGHDGGWMRRGRRDRKRQGSKGHQSEAKSEEEDGRTKAKIGNGSRGGSSREEGGERGERAKRRKRGKSVGGRGDGSRVMKQEKRGDERQSEGGEGREEEA